MESHQFAGVERRALLKAIAAVSGAAILRPFGDLMAQTTKGRTGRGRIDVHHHFSPPSWVAQARAVGASTGLP